VHSLPLSVQESQAQVPPAHSPPVVASAQTNGGPPTEPGQQSEVAAQDSLTRLQLPQVPSPLQKSPTQQPGSVGWSQLAPDTPHASQEQAVVVVPHAAPLCSMQLVPAQQAVAAGHDVYCGVHVAGTEQVPPRQSSPG